MQTRVHQRRPLGRALLAVAAALALSGAAQARTGQAPNVLFVMADDLAADIPGVKTPNMDTLRAEGVDFSQAYTQYPVCGQSRASLLTGVRPNTIGHENNFEKFRCALPDVVTLPQFFKNDGYESVRIGKLYHQGVPSDMGTAGPDDPASWSRTINPLGLDRELEKQLVNFTPGAGLGMALAYLKADVDDRQLTDAVSVDDATRILAAQKKGDAPLFLAVGFYRPHVPEIVPRKYFDMYSDAEVDRIAEDDEAGFDDILFASKNSLVADMGTTPQQQREFRHAYYAAVSYVDAQLGRLIDQLKRQGKWDNTIVVFTADHGFMLGQHGLWEKTTLYDGAVNVPLIVSAPGYRKGAKVTKPVELVDVYPTVLELAGKPANTANEGVSLTPLMRNPKDPSWNRPAYSQVFGGRSVRTERYRYTEWSNAFGPGMIGVQLFDYSQPHPESRNLAEDPANRTLVAKFNAQLAAQIPLQRGEVREVPFVQYPQGNGKIPRPPRPQGDQDPCAVAGGAG